MDEGSGGLNHFLQNFGEREKTDLLQAGLPETQAVIWDVQTTEEDWTRVYDGCTRFGPIYRYLAKQGHQNDTDVFRVSALPDYSWGGTRL